MLYFFISFQITSLPYCNISSAYCTLLHHTILLISLSSITNVACTVISLIGPINQISNIFYRKITSGRSLLRLYTKTFRRPDLSLPSGDKLVSMFFLPAGTKHSASSSWKKTALKRSISLGTKLLRLALFL